MLASFSLLGALQTSRSVDGIRHFWLYEEPMAALRSARQLAEGGRHSEPADASTAPAGLLWTLVLVAIERSGIPDAKAALAVLLLNAALAGCVVGLATRLLRRLMGPPGLGLPVLLLALVPSFDLVFWTVNGFETPLLVALFLLGALRVLADADAGALRAPTLALLALLPLARADGLAFWSALALLALGLVPHRRVACAALALSLLPAALQPLVPAAWESGWPSARATVALAPTGADLGLRYLGRFARGYGVAMVLAALGALSARDRRRALLLAGPAFSAVWLLAFGGEALPGSPYLAPFVPVVLALAAATVGEAAHKERGRAVVLGAALLVPAALPLRSVWPTRLAASEPAGMVAGVMIARYSSPRARVGVFASGNVPFFSRRRPVDLLLSADPERALDARPDLVVVHLPHESVRERANGREAPRDRQEPVLRSAAFREEYLPYPLAVLERTTLYFRSGSSERQRASWRVPLVRP